MVLTFHVVGDAYVDIFSFLQECWPEVGGDSRLEEPVTFQPGGSSVNTATQLSSLSRQLVSAGADDEKPKVILQTVLNPNDQYGQLLIEHVTKHEIPLVNCRREDENYSTGHCICVVQRGERSFMTHQGCVGNFAASDIHVDQIIETDGPVHMHIAGFFNLHGFWYGRLRDQLIRIREERKKRYPNQPTTISLVTQYDATNQWDGGIDEVISHLDFLILNEVEADRILQRGKGGDIDPNADPVEQWIPFFSGLNPDTFFIVTRGARGAIAFSSGKLIASLDPAVVVDVVDPTGAGDAFTAGFLHGISWAQKRENHHLDERGWTSEMIKQGLLWGCSVGTAAVTVRFASVPPGVEDILSLYEQQKVKE